MIYTIETSIGDNYVEIICNVEEPELDVGYLGEFNIEKINLLHPINGETISIDITSLIDNLNLEELNGLCTNKISEHRS